MTFGLAIVGYKRIWNGICNPEWSSFRRLSGALPLTGASLGGAEADTTSDGTLVNNLVMRPRMLPTKLEHLWGLITVEDQYFFVTAINTDYYYYYHMFRT